MAYVRNAWYVASWSGDVVPQRPISIRILDDPLVIWRNEAGSIVAFYDRCVHRFAPLSLGRCEGERLRCMYHGMLYDRAGRVVEIPGQEQIAPTARVRAFPVIERHGWVWVWMGAHERADEQLLPPVIGVEHADYILGTGQVDYAAEARLINDNLLDLSHTPFVHQETFAPSHTWALQRPKVTPQARGVRIERWIRNEPLTLNAPVPKFVDTYHRYDVYVPGVLVMKSGAFPVGTAEAVGEEEPDFSRAQSDVTLTSQAVTPMTERTTRYFFSMGCHRDHGNEAHRDAMVAVAQQAFAEDKRMIEAQQANLDRSAGVNFMPTTADRAVILFNRLLETLAREESQGL